MPLDFFHGLWGNHCKRVYHFTGSKPVFQPKRKFSFARLLRSIRSDWEDVKCKSNIFWFLDFKSFVTHCWIKIISVSHFSPASRPLRSPTSSPSLSRLPYPSRHYSPGLPPPCPPSHSLHPTLLVWKKVSSKERLLDFSEQTLLRKYLKRKSVFKSHLLERGYSEKLIQTTLLEVKFEERKFAL